MRRLFLFPRATSQTDMPTCPFGGAVCRWHTASTEVERRPAARVRFSGIRRDCRFESLIFLIPPRRLLFLLFL